jgi:hypothetical protein
MKYNEKVNAILDILDCLYENLHKKVNVFNAYGAWLDLKGSLMNVKELSVEDLDAIFDFYDQVTVAYRLCPENSSYLLDY